MMIVRKLCIMSCFLAATAGCAVGPKYEPPQAPVPAGWIGAANAATTQPAGPTTRPVSLTTWWDSFNDPMLNALIDRAAEANPDLHVAEARVREARALRDVAAADFWPQILFGGSYAYRASSRNAAPRVRSGPGFGKTILNNVLNGIRIQPGQFNPVTNAFGPPTISAGSPGGLGNSISLGSLTNRFLNSTPRPPRAQNLFQVGFDASWEMDFFGRIRRSVEAAEADLAAADEARRNVLVTLLSDVALNYAQLRGSQRRLLIANENIRAQQDTVDLTTSRYEAGFTNELDVAQARAQLEITRSLVPVFESAIRQSIYQLSVLLGQPPAGLLAELAPVEPIPEAPVDVPTGLPSELLRRRPDIRQAERLVAATTARIGVATADLFPRVSLTGSFGTQSSDMRHFMDNKSMFWSVGPGVQWPIFDGGRIQANIRAEVAREQQALGQYQSIVLAAFQDVENALVAYGQERIRRKTLAAAVQASQLATELSNDLYTRGLGPFLNVLESQRTLFAAQDQMVQSETAVTTNLIALYKALGGGWDATDGTTLANGNARANQTRREPHQEPAAAP